MPRLVCLCLFALVDEGCLFMEEHEGVAEGARESWGTCSGAPDHHGGLTGGALEDPGAGEMLGLLEEDFH
jgi:hypothetical protein